MTNMIKKAGMFVATSALVLSLVPGAMAADVTVTVEDNGAKSNQKVILSETNNTTVDQKNTTEVVNIQSANASTGGNSIKNSTGEGNESITTGNAKATNTLNVMGGSNTYIPSDCGCDSTTDVLVSGNGYKSKTKVKETKSNTKTTKQKTKTSVLNVQGSDADSGNNKIKNGTGDADRTVETGNAKAKNKATVESGSNFIGPDVL